jgi:hypothetical protein
MVILKAFVKMSGSLLDNEEVVGWLRKLAKKYSVTICIGGGAQINEAFKRMGFKIKFGPLGRITDSAEERRLARIILEKNRIAVQDLLKKKRISARVIVPLDDIAGVLCPVNGDVKLLSAYNGYDRLYLLTLKKRVAKKKSWLKQVAHVFSTIEKGELDKIEIVGF